MNPLPIIAAVLWAASAAAAAWWGMGVGRDQCEAQAAREERLVASAAEASASAAAGAISRITVRHQTIKSEVQRDVIEKPVFRDCRSGADAVRLFNDTIPGAGSAASAPGAGRLPAAHAPD